MKRGDQRLEHIVNVPLPGCACWEHKTTPYYIYMITSLFHIYNIINRNENNMYIIHMCIYIYCSVKKQHHKKLCHHQTDYGLLFGLPAAGDSIQPHNIQACPAERCASVLVLVPNHQPDYCWPLFSIKYTYHITILVKIKGMRLWILLDPYGWDHHYRDESDEHPWHWGEHECARDV